MGEDPKRYVLMAQLAEREGDYQRADHWYKCSLATDDALIGETALKFFYHEVADLAMKRNDLSAMEFWYRKALEIEEKEGKTHQAAGTAGKLAIVKMSCGDYMEAGKWIIRSMVDYKECNSASGVKLSLSTFRKCCRLASQGQRLILERMWKEKGLGPIAEGSVWARLWRKGV